jgi:hypothetical protein
VTHYVGDPPVDPPLPPGSTHVGGSIHLHERDLFTGEGVLVGETRHPWAATREEGDIYHQDQAQGWGDIHQGRLSLIPRLRYHIYQMMSAHRCQGATLTGITIMHVRDAFAPTIVYVMLSRVTTRDNLLILGQLKPADFVPVNDNAFMAMDGDAQDSDGDGGLADTS